MTDCNCAAFHRRASVEIDPRVRRGSPDARSARVSLLDVTVDLAPVTVLVGRSGTGKSNFADRHGFWGGAR